MNRTTLGRRTTMDTKVTKETTKKIFVGFVIFVVLIFAVSVAAHVGRAQTPRAAPDPAKEKRLEWFRDAKYGLFIHWGLYAIPAGEWQGKRSLGLGEWIMNRSTIPVRDYERLSAQFNPVKYNADEWVKLAKEAGMKYIVITSKHHDGFAMFKSKASAYNIVDATPFKRDVLKELADACARQNMRLGFYYSQSQDWHEPNGAGNTWDFGPDEKKDYDQYLRGKAEPQVKELLTSYGPVALIWFDTPRMMTGTRAQRFAEIVRSVQPATLIDGRLGSEGDYVSTGDNVIPPQVNGQAWETPATINHTWGYRKDDTDWKSPGQIIFKLVDIVSKGGNYLLNVGPMSGARSSPSNARFRIRWPASSSWNSRAVGSSADLHVSSQRREGAFLCAAVSLRRDSPEPAYFAGFVASCSQLPRTCRTDAAV